MQNGNFPILTCDEARALELAHLASDEAREWPAMQGAGRGIVGAVLRDFEEIGGLPAAARVLVLAGKGNNGGDAMLAAVELRARCPGVVVEVLFVFGERALRPLAQRAWRELSAAGGRAVEEVALAGEYDLCIDVAQGKCLADSPSGGG
jgi:ADP-dependent NAD(P)H-hydrate dehydratase / NAD(P)H-hydrate epimerase